jgi:protein-S-isoprenylcysteine O-methyltransferase Ste14
MTVGMLFSLYSLKTLGVSFGIMPQVRTLIQSGPYKVIRHPLYVGEIMTLGGAILTGFSCQKLGIFLLVVAIQSYRAVQEEKLLEAILPEYSAYKASTRRFIPGLL